MKISMLSIELNLWTQFMKKENGLSVVCVNQVFQEQINWKNTSLLFMKGKNLTNVISVMKGLHGLVLWKVTLLGFTKEMKKRNGSNVVCVNLGKDYHIDGQNTQLSLFEKEYLWGRENYTLGGINVGPWSFIILKNSHQDLSNEILSSLEVAHWVTHHKRFLTNCLKLQILASYNNLRVGQDSEFVMFWPRALTM